MTGPPDLDAACLAYLAIALEVLNGRDVYDEAIYSAVVDLAAAATRVVEAWPQ